MCLSLATGKGIDTLNWSFATSILIGVGTSGYWGHVSSQDFAINKGVPFLFLENDPFLQEKVPSKCRAPKFQMLPTTLSILIGPSEMAFWKGV